MPPAVSQLYIDKASRVLRQFELRIFLIPPH